MTNNKIIKYSLILSPGDYSVLLKVLKNKDVEHASALTSGFDLGYYMLTRVIKTIESNSNDVYYDSIKFTLVDNLFKEDLDFILRSIHFCITNNIIGNKDSIIKIERIIENLIIEPEFVNSFEEFTYCADHTVITHSSANLYSNLIKINFTYPEASAIGSSIKAFCAYEEMKRLKEGKQLPDSVILLKNTLESFQKLIKDWGPYDINCIVFTSIKELTCIELAVLWNAGLVISWSPLISSYLKMNNAKVFSTYCIQNNLIPSETDHPTSKNPTTKNIDLPGIGTPKIIDDHDNKIRILFTKTFGSGGNANIYGLGGQGWNGRICGEGGKFTNYYNDYLFNLKQKIKDEDLIKITEVVQDIPDQKEDQSLEDYFESVIMELSKIIQIDTYDLGTFCRDITSITKRVSSSTSIIDDVKILKDEFFNNFINGEIPDISYVPGWWIKRILEEFKSIEDKECDKVEGLINNLKTADRLRSIMEYLSSEVEKIYPSEKVKKED